MELYHEPARMRLIPGHDGQAPVIESVTTTRVDADALGEALYEYYAHQVEEASGLPERLSRDDVARVLGEHAADCAQGWHTFLYEPSDAIADVVRPWARAQVSALFPEMQQSG